MDREDSYGRDDVDSGDRERKQVVGLFKCTAAAIEG